MLFFKRYDYYISLCCIVKDEDEYLEEWINYHHKIGIEKFYFYDNESKTPLKVSLNHLIKKGIVNVDEISGKPMQMAAYADCLKKYGKKSRWIGFIDMDEFIVPKSTNGDLKKFLKQYESYGGLGINWLMFGSSGRKQKSEKPLLESFILRNKSSEKINDHIKSIVQTKHTKSVGLDPHHFIFKNGKYCVNENFDRIDGPFSPNHTDKIQLNHYYCKSLEEFQNKIIRGRADTTEIQRSLNDFYSHDEGANEIEDYSLLNILKKLE